LPKTVFALALLAGALSSALSAQPAASSTGAAKISAADFAAQPTLANALLSPDGRWIAAQKQASDKAMLVLINADEPNGKRVEVSLGKAYVVDMNWAGSRKVLLTLASIGYFYGTPVPISRLMAFDIVTRQAIPLDPKSNGIFAGDVLYVDPAGAWTLVASQDRIDVTPSVKRVDLATGAATLVEKTRHDVWNWYADSRGVVRGGLAYDNKSWTLWYRETPAEPLRPLRGKFDKNDGSIDRFIFNRQDGTGAILTNEKTGRFAAYKYDFKTAAIGEPIYEHPQVDISTILMDPDTGKIRGIRYQDDRWRTHWLDSDLSGLQAKLDRALPGAANSIVGLSSDKNRALILSVSSSDPQTYFLLDRKAARMHPVIDVFDRIDPARLTPVEWVDYTARDGLKIPAYLTLPRGKEAKALPLILMPHGGPFARDDWEYDPLVQFLADRGYAVLQPQFRGSTGYGKAFVESGYGQWGRKMQDDLDDGVDWLVRSGKVDPKRVCIFGASYGGYAALWGVIRNPEKYRCAVSYAGVSDLSAQLRDNRKSFSATRYFRKWRTKVAGEGNIDLRTVSPIRFADKLKVPVLIAHGEQDSVVAARQSHAMVEALTKSGSNVAAAFYKDAGHDFDNAANMEDFLRRLEAFLMQYNPVVNDRGPL